MEFEFVNYKSELTYIILLPKLAFKYCNNPDGKIYTSYRGIEKNNELIEALINQLTPKIINKKNAIILNLLVNPFFDDLCAYLLKSNKINNINNSKIKLIKKYIFTYLCDDFTKKIYSDLNVEGATIYANKKMYEKSKKMLEKL